MLDVYRTYYKLTGEPFRLSPDHRFSLAHRSYANAKAYLDYALLQGEGFIAITGGPGTGKTTLIGDILAGFEQTDMQVATLTSTQLESRDLLHMVAHSFDLHPEDRSKANLLLELERFLNQQSYRGHRTILIVDEAQSLSPSALEELRLLANIQRKDQLLLQIFLVGQEKLLDLIRGPGMEQLQQRLVAASVLEPLDLDETVDYVEHRLRLVAWKGDPAISEEALRLVYKYSGGIPRRINMICNRLFLYGGMQQKHKLLGDDAGTVIEELRQEFLLPAELPAKTADVAEKAVEPSPEGAKAAARSLPRRGQFNAGAAKPTGQPSSSPPQDSQRWVENKPMRPRTEQLDATRPDWRERDSLASRRATARSERTVPDFNRQAVGRAGRPASRRVGSAEPAARQRKGKHRGMAAAALFLMTVSSLAVILSTDTRLEGLLNVVGLGESRDSVKTLLKTGVHKAVKVFPGGEEAVGLESQSVQSDQTESADAVVVPGASDRDLAGEADTTSIAATPVMPAAEVEEPVETETTDTASMTTAPATAAAAVTMDAEKDEAIRPESRETETSDEDAKTVSAPPPSSPVKAATENSKADAKNDDEAYAAAIEAEYGKLRRVADERFSQRRTRVGSEAEKVTPSPTKPPAAAVVTGNSVTGVSQPKLSMADVSAPKESVSQSSQPRLSEPKTSLPKASVPKAALPKVSEPRPTAPRVSEPKISAPPVSKPKITVAAATAVTTPGSGTKKRALSQEKIRSALLEGQWTSQGKPASLLPSEITFCNSQGKQQIGCWSVAQNINTKYGPALYKVETTLKGFSSGSFKLSYRTLVKLVDAGASASAKEKAAASKDGWQVTEHSMQCQLTQPDAVLCRDQKGVTRNYRRSGSKNGL